MTYNQKQVGWKSEFSTRGYGKIHPKFPLH